MVETKDTGWKSPQGVIQKTKSINGNHKCYPFSDLDDIKKDDMTYAYIDTSGGITANHKSPIIYTYNYGFKIPSDATVTKITLLTLVQCGTVPKEYYQRKLKKRYGKTFYNESLAKWFMVKLRNGTTSAGGEIGNNFYDKSNSLVLPLKEWTTSKNGTFTGTPKEWGLTGNIVNTINNGGFGVAIQFIGTHTDGWCNPRVAKLKLKVEYTLPSKPDTTPTESEFTKLTVKYNNNSTTDSTVSFNSNNTASLGNYQRNSTKPIILTFEYTHKGLSGETPFIQLKSSSLTFGSTEDAQEKKTTVKNSYTLPKIHCNRDDSEKVYSHKVMIFSGLLVGTQKITYTYDNKEYTLTVNITESQDVYGDVDLVQFKSKFENLSQQVMINNCLFIKNHALGTGGAVCITSENYDGKNNIYGAGANVNVADNKYSSVKCKDTLWLKKCVTITNGIEKR